MNIVDNSHKTQFQDLDEGDAFKVKTNESLVYLKTKRIPYMGQTYTNCVCLLNGTHCTIDETQEVEKLTGTFVYENQD